MFWWPEVYAWLVLTGRPVDARWTLDQVTPDARAHLPRVAGLPRAKPTPRPSRPYEGDAAALSHGVALSDAEWARIEPLLPSEGRGLRFRKHRQVAEGMVHRYRTGVAWRNLPAHLGPWRTVFGWHQRFCRDGILGTGS